MRARETRAEVPVIQNFEASIAFEILNECSLVANM